MNFFLVSVCFAVCVIGFSLAHEDLKIITREDWGGKPPKKAPTPLQELPAPYVIVSHTVSKVCLTQAQCAQSVRSIQTGHMSKGWDDIGYNFLVGGDGNVYQGRGWGVSGAHTVNFNARSIGLSFIGNFDVAMPTDAQIAAARDLLEYGLKNGNLGEKYKLLGHRQLSSTQSPGQKLYDIIQTWDHWSPKP